jgi:hypothetical protein
VVLRHHPNEAESGNYDGLHQWNFDCQEEQFIIWNKNGRCNVAERFSGIATCQARMINGNAVATLRKTVGGADFLSQTIADRRRERIAEMMSTMIGDILKAAS